MNWPLVPLGEVLQPVSRPEAVEPERKYKLLGAHWYAKGLYIKDTKAGSGIQAKWVYRVEEGDFVYNRLFAWMGSFAVASVTVHNCYVSNEFPCFTVNRERAIGGYLWHYFSRQSAWSEALGLSSGGTPTSRNRLKEEKLLGMAIPLPALEEQRRIVSRVDAIASRVTEARRLREESTQSAETIKLARLKTIFTQLNSNIETARLGDLLCEAGYGTSIKCDATRTNAATPVLRIPNVASELLSLDNLKYASLPTTELEKTSLQTGDLLVVRTNGSADLVGRCAVVRSLPEVMSFASYLIRLRADLVRIDCNYLQRYLAYARLSGILIDFARTTAGQYNVSLGRLASCQVPLPPLEEQRRIVAYLDALQAKLDAVRAEQEASATELEALLPSVLNRAFAGEL